MCTLVFGFTVQVICVFRGVSYKANAYIVKILPVKKQMEMKSRGVKLLPNKDSNQKTSVCKCLKPITTPSCIAIIPPYILHTQQWFDGSPFTAHRHLTEGGWGML